MSMKIKNRKSVIEDLKKFDMAADKDDFIEVCEWPNGEGFDISITDKKIIGFTRGELEAINFLTKILDYNIDDAAYSKTNIIDDINSINNEIKLY